MLVLGLSIMSTTNRQTMSRIDRYDHPNADEEDASNAKISDLPTYLTKLSLKYQIPIKISFYTVNENMELREKSHRHLLDDLSYARSKSYGLFIDELINIALVVDDSERPVKIIFQDPVPRIVIKILSSVIQNHPYLVSIEMRGKGHSPYSIYEINKMLPHSNITDICFDGTRIRSRNYYIILDETTTVTSLSLARCSITDDIVEEIANRLYYGKPAAKCLQVLNLSSNIISDCGATALAKMLETNRKLCYLNLSNNEITDIGAIAILDTLKSFNISNDEFREARQLHLAYLNQKEIAAKEFLDKLKNKVNSAGASVKPKPKSARKQPTSIKARRSISGSEMTFTKAEILMKFPDFDCPFYVEASPLPGGGATVRGNGTICRLNLSYNSLTELTLARAIPIMNLAVEGQRGIFLFCVEGTMLPVSGALQTKADKLTDIQLNMYGRRGPKSVPRRRKSSK